MGMEGTARILVVDDERVIREILTDFLNMEGYTVDTADDGNAAIERLDADTHYDLVITDLKMPNIGGIELIDHISSMRNPPVVLVMTGFGTVETAIAAMKKGAYDYILKPFKVEEVLHIIQRALEKRRLSEENIQLKETLSLYSMSEALNSSLSIDRVLEILLDTSMAEVDADAVSLLLRDQDNGGDFRPAIEQTTYDAASEVKLDLVGQPSIDALTRAFETNEPVLAHKEEINPYFDRMPGGKMPTAFMSLPLKVRDRLVGILGVYAYQPGMRFTEGQRKLLSVLAGRAATALENARLYEELKTMFRETLEALILALEAKDRYTAGHTKRVTEYTRMIVESMGMAESQREVICQGAMLHDIGKIGIDPQKINKPGKLTDEEMAMFRSHPAIGKRIVQPIKFLEDIIPCVYYHHEKYDGSGYPEGLRGHNIPLGARIVAVADTYDAMTSTRAYRKALSHEVAAAELRRCRGTQFDPEVVDNFLGELDRRRGPRTAELAREAAMRDEVAPEYYALQQLGKAPEEPAAEEIGGKRNGSTP